MKRGALGAGQGGRAMVPPGRGSGDREEGGVGAYFGGASDRPYLQIGRGLRGKGGEITGEPTVWRLSNWLAGDPASRAEGEGAGEGVDSRKQ